MIFVNAQVTYTRISMPAGYGLVHSGWQLGAGKPLFQNNGIIYGFTNKELTTGGWEGYLYAYDTVNNNFSIYTDTVFPYYSDFNNFNVYNNNIYFNGAGNLYKINLATNVLSFIFDGSVNYFIKNNKIYSIGENSISSKLKIYNLNDDSISEPWYYEDPNSTIKYYYYTNLIAQNNNDHYLYGFTIAENGGQWLQKIIKIDSNDIVSVAADVPNPVAYPNYTGLFDTYSSTYILNNKMILNRGDRVDTYDINSNVFTENFYSLGITNNSTLLDNGWLYFNNANLTTLKTNGLNVLGVDFNRFFQTGFTADDQPTLKLNNYYYGSDFSMNPYLNRSSLTATSTQFNITSSPTAISPNSAFIYNSKLFYFSGSRLFKYDDIANTNIELSTEDLAPGTNFIVTSGSSAYKYCIGNAGFGMYKIDLSNAFLSTQENQKPTLKLYPNPTKSTLNFSEELSEIKIVDMSGKQVSRNQGKSKTINVENLPKGNYLITAKDKNGKTISEKFIKE